MSNLSLYQLQDILPHYYYCTCHKFVHKQNIRRHLKQHANINKIMIDLNGSELAIATRDKLITDMINDYFENKI